MSTTTSNPSFSIPFFTQLIHRLRHTNARYHQIAYQCRHTYHPTYHAKQRAFRSGLRIDTSKASIELDDPISEFASTEDEGEEKTDADLDATVLQLTGAHAPELFVQKTFAIGMRLSPIEFELGFGVDVDDTDMHDLQFHEYVPGAPKLWPRLLPEDDEDEGELTPLLLSSRVQALEQYGQSD